MSRLVSDENDPLLQPTQRDPISTLLSRLKAVTQEMPDQWKALCPAHDDRNPSLSIKRGDDGRALVYCFAGCTIEGILKKLNLRPKDLLPSTGLTIEEFAAAKKLPVKFLSDQSIATIAGTEPYVRFPYGEAERRRFALDGPNKFRWKPKSKLSLYGLWRLKEVKDRGFVVLVEGESDALTLWYNNYPALGIPGAGTWREEWAGDLDDVETIYVIIEPDKGGDATLKWLSSSSIRDRAKLVQFPKDGDVKDPSALWLKDQGAFAATFQEMLDAAPAWSGWISAETVRVRDAAYALCEELTKERWIMDLFTAALHEQGVAGEDKAASLIYLLLTTRFQDRPVSAAIKAVSSSGKSYLVDQILKFFPESSYFARTSITERTLAYTDFDYRNKYLVLFEASGIQGEFGSYLIRELLSRGRIEYETTEKNQTTGQIQTRLVTKEGPTGLLVTTVLSELEHQLETRLMSIPLTDTKDQTRAIMSETAAKEMGKKSKVNLEQWQAYQTWLETGERRVFIPYAGMLLDLIPPFMTRLRRDHSSLLALIRASAMMHQANRVRDKIGRIVASIDDYTIVYSYYGDLFTSGLEAGVPETVRETVLTVEKLHASLDHLPTNKDIGKALNLDRTAVAKRVENAARLGYIKNAAQKGEKPFMWVVDQPMPSDEALPKPERLLRVCEDWAVVDEGQGALVDVGHEMIRNYELMMDKMREIKSVEARGGA
jgi:hypothetical protein